MPDFSQSAKAVTRSMDQVFDASQKSFDFTAISKAAIKGRSLERRAASEAEGRVALAGINAVAKTKSTKIRMDAKKEAEAIKKPARKMAGVVGALGSLAGAAVLAKGAKADKAAAEKRDAAYEARTARIENILSNRDNVGTTPYQEIPEFDTSKLVDLNTDPLPGAESTDSSNSSSTVTDTSSTTATTDTSSTSQPTVKQFASMSLAGPSDVDALTPEDYKYLAYAIDSEAGPGKDRYGVAASILNRVKSDKFPGTVKDVIFQDGQYEGVYKGLSNYNPGIAADLSSDAGKTQINSALKILDGRTDFKGQSQLQHRSNKGNKGGMMDPMFDTKGNFFHYHWQ